MTKKANPYIVVRKSRIHSRGVFARCDIRKGTRVIEYVGEKVTKRESHRRADEMLRKAQQDETRGKVYLFVLDNHYDIDGNVPYNTARLINHSCDPNCETDIINGRIWIMALRSIKKGEEITYDYGYDIDDYEDHICLCRTERCRGYIVKEDHWPKLKKLLAKQQRKQRKTHLSRTSKNKRRKKPFQSQTVAA